MNLAYSALFAVLLWAAGKETASAQACENLAHATLPHTAITQAQIVTAGRTGGSAFPGTNAAGDLPPFCRVAATLKPSDDSAIRIEVWMPLAGWNGKFMGVGNGGWAGSIPYREMSDPLRRGYAVASTDTGHSGDGLGGGFALGHPERLIDFGYRAVHEMTVAAKALATTFYGKTPRWSYWIGGSTGGKQGLTEAQRYPEDYDGIVAAAPVNYWTRVMPHLIWLWRSTNDDPARHIPPGKYPLIHRAVLDACDAGDGLRDDLLSDPARCRFDPAVLLCSAGEAADCLTAPQIEAVKQLYAPFRNSRTGAVVSPGLLPGSELGWAPVVGGQRPFQIPDDYFKFVVFKNPEWNFRTLDFDRDITASDDAGRPVLDATDPDLRKFAGHSGKLIVFHGWNDQLISPLDSVDYHDAVVKRLGTAKTRAFMRVFMVPGMSHQPASSGGPISFDLIAPLEQWVEKGIAPERVVVSYLKEGKVERTRPACPYPQVPAYSGAGTPADAANFTCGMR